MPRTRKVRPVYRRDRMQALTGMFAAVQHARLCGARGFCSVNAAAGLIYDRGFVLGVRWS